MRSIRLVAPIVGIIVLLLAGLTTTHSQGVDSTSITLTPSSTTNLPFSVEAKWLDVSATIQLTFTNTPDFVSGRVELLPQGSSSGAIYRFTSAEVNNNQFTLADGSASPETSYDIRVELTDAAGTRTEIVINYQTGSLFATPTLYPTPTQTPVPANIAVAFYSPADGSAYVSLNSTTQTEVAGIEISVYENRLPTSIPFNPTSTTIGDPSTSIPATATSASSTLVITSTPVPIRAEGSSSVADPNFNPVWQQTILPTIYVTHQVDGLVPGKQYYIYAQAFNDQGSPIGTGSYFVNSATYNPRSIDYITYFLFRTPQGILITLVGTIIVVGLTYLLIRRQQKWLAIAGEGRFAILPVLRKRVIRRQGKILKDLNFEEFVSILPERGTPRFKIRQWNERIQALGGITQNRSIINHLSSLISDIDKARPFQNKKPAEAYDYLLTDELIRHLRKHYESSETRYWSLEDDINKLQSRLSLTPIENPELIPSYVQQDLEKLTQNLSAWQNEISHYGDYLSEQDRLALSTIADVNLNIEVLSRREVREEANDVLTTLSVLRNQISQAQAAYPEKLAAFTRGSLSSKGATHPSSMHLTLEILQNHINAIETRIREFLTIFDDKLTSVLESLETLDDLVTIDAKLEEFPRSGLAPLTIRIIAQLRSIQQEVRLSNSLALNSYPQRRAISEAYIKSNRLIGQLEAEGTPTAKTWITHVQRIRQLFEEKQPDIASLEQKLYTNPYVPGAPISVSAVALFKGRRDIIERINTTLRSSGKPTILIYGPRRMGKSSLLAHLPNDLLPPEYISVYFDAQGSSQSEQSFFFALASNIHAVIQDRSRRDISPPIIKDYANVPFTVFEDWLKRHISPLLQNQKLFITIDEFEKIGEAIRATEQIDQEIRSGLRDPETRPKNAMTRGMLDHLRNIIQHKSEIVLLFSGVQTLDALAPNAANYFLQVESIELSYLDEQSARELVLEPVPVDFGRVPKYDEDALGEILYLSNRQPFLIQAMCSALVDIANEQELETITLDHVYEVSNLIQKKFAFYFDEIWDSVGKGGQQVLLDVVKGGKTNNNEQTLIIVENLIQRHVLRTDKLGYSLEIPLIGTWIKREKLNLDT